MAEQHLTKSELAIMEVMWEQEEALTASEIIKASGDKEWKNRFYSSHGECFT
mgnify:CR=1 FL=1